MDKSNNLNIIRFTLAYTVFISHFIYLNNISFYNSFFENMASFAVKSFFLISGLLITRSYLNRKSLYDFYKKRALRIFPAYYLMLMVLLIFSLFSSEEKFMSYENFTYFLYNFIFLNFLNPINPNFFTDNFSKITNGSLWTIKIELCLYFITPLLIKIINKKILKIILIIILSTIWFLFFSMHEIEKFKPLAIQFPGQLRFFLFGSIIYLYYKDFVIKPFSYMIIISFAIISYIKMKLLFIIFEPILIGFLIYFIGLKHKKITFIKSDISYGIYLFHFPIIQAFITHDNFGISLIYIFFIQSVLIILLSFLSWNVIEKKILGR